MSAPQVVTATTTPATEFVREVPSSLKQLARLVVRGFYGIEDALVVDMLVRHPCMREDDIAGLLKFDRKMLRARMTILKNDKILQLKQRIETDEDGKVVKMNCYYINYRTFVNVLKYKLDHMRKKMETSERDQTSRSSFKCLNCNKNFTDLEAHLLLEPMSGEMRCTHCSGVVDEDEASGPQKDSRQLLAKFNLEMKPLYELLHLVESVNLAPDLLEPEPVDVDLLTGKKSNKGASKQDNNQDGTGKWSGDATRSQGLREENQHVEIAIGDDAVDEATKKKKHEVPVWITQSAIVDPYAAAMDNEPEVMDETDSNARETDQNDAISEMLLKHERKAGDGNRAIIPGDSGSDKSDDSDMEDIQVPTASKTDASKMSSSDDDDSGVPMVRVGSQEYALTDIKEDIIEQMTPEERDRYTQVFQEFYADLY